MQATEYRRRAAEAEEKAKSVGDPEVKNQLLNIAQAWRELARETQRLADKGASHPTNAPSSN